MDDATLQDLMDALMASQAKLNEVFSAVEKFQEWAPAPDRWSFRSIAAHMATAEAECFLTRAQRLKDEPFPTFEYYDNSDRDFRGIELTEATTDWKAARGEFAALIQGMTLEERRRVGRHVTFGTMGLEELLNLMLEHDREHLDEVEHNLERYRSIHQPGKQ